MGESLRRARNEYGVNVSIMASTGNGLATGSQSNSDFIIDTQYTSGAIAPRWGSASKQLSAKGNRLQQPFP